MVFIVLFKNRCQDNPENQINAKKYSLALKKEETTPELGERVGLPFHEKRRAPYMLPCIP